ncbi:hypothetical protein OKW43_007617 [Paraburkholderia sp. WC7.3g]
MPINDYAALREFKCPMQNQKPIQIDMESHISFSAAPTARTEAESMMTRGKVDPVGGTQRCKQDLVEPIPDAGLLPVAQAPPATDTRSTAPFRRADRSSECRF